MLNSESTLTPMHIYFIFSRMLHPVYTYTSIIAEQTPTGMTVLATTKAVANTARPSTYVEI